MRRNIQHRKTEPVQAEGVHVRSGGELGGDYIFSDSAGNQLIVKLHDSSCLVDCQWCQWRFISAKTYHYSLLGCTRLTGGNHNALL